MTKSTERVHCYAICNTDSVYPGILWHPTRMPCVMGEAPHGSIYFKETVILESILDLVFRALEHQNTKGTEEKDFATAPIPLSSVFRHLGSFVLLDLHMKDLLSCEGCLT